MKTLLTTVLLMLVLAGRGHAHEESWTGMFNTSAYLANCTGTFRTASGKFADPAKRYIAVDPKVIPMGSKVCVDSMGCYTAEDTGGAIKGHRLDILVSSMAVARQWGRRNVQATVYPKHKHY